MNIPINIETLLAGKVVESERIDDISPFLLRNHLRQINSRLFSQSETLPHRDLCVQMNLAEGTGIPTIKRALAANGSPPAKYDTDGDGDERRYFVTEIPVHPEFIADTDSQVEKVSNQVSNQVENLAVARIITILEFCIEAKTKKEIFSKIGFIVYDNT